MENKENIDHSAKLLHLEERLKKLEQKAIKKTHQWRYKFNKKHHFLYVFIAFIGLTMVWYAVWTIISDIPIINNPYVSGGLGLLILLILGKFFNRIV